MAISEEDFAAALVAGMTGQILKDVDRNTVQQSSAGPANKLDPMSFVRPGRQSTPQQENITAQLNAEAERLFPLPDQPMPSAPTGVAQSVAPAVQQIHIRRTEDAPATNDDITKTLKSIDRSLRKLVTIVEKKWTTN
jgi:hypothetical protein